MKGWLSPILRLQSYKMKTMRMNLLSTATIILKMNATFWLMRLPWRMRATLSLINLVGSFNSCTSQMSTSMPLLTLYHTRNLNKRMVLSNSVTAPEMPKRSYRRSKRTSFSFNGKRIVIFNYFKISDNTILRLFALQELIHKKSNL